MDLILRSAGIYFALLVVFRLAGRRTLGDTTTFDLILLLVVSEAVQQALFGKTDPSLTSAFIVVVTLVGLDVAFSFLKNRRPKVGMWIDGVPMVLVANGRVLEERLIKSRINLSDVLSVARQNGYLSLDEIDVAVLEPNGRISIIPKPAAKN